MSPPALLTVLRGAHDAALLSAFGALLFPWAMGADAALVRRSRRLGAWSAFLALGLGAAWLWPRPLWSPTRMGLRGR